MAKHLRIDIAELTDIGRRRSNNQDNVATKVPNDQREIDRAGALFVVADGMGGHAAGEIASTVAVQTVTATYDEFYKDDVIDALERTVRKANEAIFTISRENADHMGMGTTLVVAIINQGLLYVANIGDGRAYLIRGGVLRQLTNDHSWVAEQVRAGVLTEEQARSHVHRNVITRSVGTQPDVTPDVFVEALKEGDTIILCSDGLHGYVDDATIKQVAEQYSPSIAVQKLVEAANEAGGPDNITVAIAHVAETPVPSHTLMERVQKAEKQRRETSPLLIPETLVKKRELVEAPTPPEPVTALTTEARPPRRRGRVALLSLAVVVVLAAVSGIAWYKLGPIASKGYNSSEVQSHITQTNRDLASLSSSGKSPHDQLIILGTDQQQLNSDLNLPNLSSDLHKQIQATLIKIVPVAQGILATYDHQALITNLGSLSNLIESRLNCPNGLMGPLVTLHPAAVAGGTAPAVSLFARDSQRHIVPITLDQQGTATCGAPISTDFSAIDMVPNGDHLDVLVQSPSTTAVASSPAIMEVYPTGGAPPKQLIQISSYDVSRQPVQLALAPNGLAFAILGRAQSGTDNDVIYVASGANFQSIVQVTCFSDSSKHVRSFSIGSNNLLYLLLDSGAVATCNIDSTGFHVIKSPIALQPVLDDGNPASFTIQTPLPISVGAPQGAGATYDGNIMAEDSPTPTPAPTATPVPTATPLPIVNGTLLNATSATTLMSAGTTTLPRLLLADPAGHRIILLDSNGGSDLTLVQQYANGDFLPALNSLTISSDGLTAYLLTPTYLIDFPLPAPGAGQPAGG